LRIVATMRSNCKGYTVKDTGVQSRHWIFFIYPDIKNEDPESEL